MQCTCRRPAVKVSYTLSMILLLAGCNLHADCLSCFVLRSVRITLKNNRTLEGYIQWHGAAYKQNAVFPRCILDRDDWIAEYSGNVPIRFYSNLYKIKYPIANVVTRSGDTTTVALAEISTIDTLLLSLDGIEGASSVQTLSDTAIHLLSSTKPLYFYKKDTGVSDDYLLSYNRNIGVVELEKMLTKLWAGDKKYGIENLEKMGVLFLVISYD
jgi:hypothetical protein